MDVNKDELARRFDEYNRLYFGGKLGRCRFSYRTFDALGLYHYDPRKSDRVKSRITICKADWTEDALRKVLVHEMIHMYVRTVLGVRYDGLFCHGIRFRRECRRMKRDFGIVITTNGYDLGYVRNDPPPKLWEKILQFIGDL